jgi:hypothetical protein
MFGMLYREKSGSPAEDTKTERKRTEMWTQFWRENLHLLLDWANTSTEETGAMGREIESCGGSFYFKRRKNMYLPTSKGRVSFLW